MKKKNNKRITIAVAGLVIVLIIGFVIIPRAISHMPESSDIETINSGQEDLAETGTGTEKTYEPNSYDHLFSLLDKENTEYFISDFSRDELLKKYPDLKIVTREQAIKGALDGLRAYGYEPEPVDFDIIALIANNDGEIEIPYLRVEFRYDYVVDREIDIQEYLDSEQFKGMSEAEIREIIECDDLSQIPYKANTEHPKYKIIDNESYTAYYMVEVNAETGEFIKATETRVRYGTELRGTEADFYGTPIGDPDLYYTIWYYTHSKKH